LKYAVLLYLNDMVPTKFKKCSPWDAAALISLKEQPTEKMLEARQKKMTVEKPTQAMEARQKKMTVEEPTQASWLMSGIMSLWETLCRDYFSLSVLFLSRMTRVYRNLEQRTLNLTLSGFFLIMTMTECLEVLGIDGGG